LYGRSTVRRREDFQLTKTTGYFVMRRDFPRNEELKAVPDTIRVRTLDAAGEREIRELSDVLIDCVEGGASVSFMLPIARTTADAFWRSVAAAVERGERILVVAENAAGEIVGTVQIVLAQVENQPHRADIAKMLVHRRARRHGVGAALLAAAESVALRAGRTLLVLDTASGDAERLYARLGWQRCGVIPGYALLPGGGLCDTTFFYRTL
jgi:GNAT superfamily N-acetyltransferase